MKENKNCQLKFRLTEALKNEIDQYCETHFMNTSEFLRMACIKALSKGDESNE